MKHLVRSVLFTLVLVSLLAGTGIALASETAIPAEDAIAKVSTIAFVDLDGPKVKAIVVEYDRPLQKGSVDLSTYQLYGYPNLPQVYDVGHENGGPEGSMEPFETYPSFAAQNGTPGEAVKVYISADGVIDPEGIGDENGRYVVIEVNTDYLLASTSDWRAQVAGGIKQMKNIETESGTISASEAICGNYTESYFWDINMHHSNHSVTLQKVLDDSLFTLEDIAEYQIYITGAEGAKEAVHTSDPDLVAYGDRDVTYQQAPTTILTQIAGDAFHATDCYSEYNGQTFEDVELQYCLYVPADYHADGRYALVMHTVDAGGLGTDPVTALTESRAAANYASEAVQQLVKEQGLDGLIVVLPFMDKRFQCVNDNCMGNQMVPAIWQLLDSLTEKYSIDPSRIYASGQSMGGMLSLYMASMRDNYFAGIWAIASQWDENNAKENVFADDSSFITNPDWKNWYYSVSDDNILITTMTGDEKPNMAWQKFSDACKAAIGCEIPHIIFDSESTSFEDENSAVKDMTSQPYEMGIYWDAITNGNHRATWIFAHGISYSYEWLLNQSQAVEEARAKIDSLKEFKE